jgi:excisionase family DNA binding protein
VAGPRPRPAFLTVDEVAALLRVDAVTIYRAIRAGEFPAVKIRKRYVIPRRALELLVEDVMVSGSCVDTATWASSQHAPAGAQPGIPPWMVGRLPGGHRSEVR